MDLESVRRFLEKGSGIDKDAGEDKNGSSIEAIPFRFFERFIMQGLQVDLVEPGRVICSMKVPPRLLNAGNFLHGGATATLVDLVGSAVIFTVGAPQTGVSVEINVSYLDAAYVNVGIINRILLCCILSLADVALPCGFPSFLTCSFQVEMLISYKLLSSVEFLLIL
ncbi:Acyl-coenzyme A thioesterase 13 [Linum perenne]